MSDTSGDLSAHIDHGLRILTCRVHCHITDTFSRQRQRFGERIAHDGIVIKIGYAGTVYTFKHDLTIRFIRDQINNMTVFLGLFAQDICQSLQCRGGIYHTGGVVGSVDQYCLDLLRQHLLKRLEVDLEVLQIGGNHLQYRSGEIHIRMIFREKRCKSQDLISRLRHQTKSMCQRSCRPGCHENVLLTIRQPKLFLQVLRNCLPDTCNTEAGTVAVQFQRFLRCQHMDHAVSKFSGNRNGRIPQAVIKYVLVSDFLSPCRSKFRKLPNHRFSRQHVFIFLN